MASKPSKSAANVNQLFQTAHAEGVNCLPGSAQESL